jgi:hypothetical protein
MAVALKALFDKRRLALTRARLSAWWDGSAFDEAAAIEAIERTLANDPETNGDAEDQLFDAPPFDLPPRLAALGVLWGEDRVRPGDDAGDRLEPARIGLAPSGTLALLGPGLVAPVSAVGGAHPGPIEVFEWREETLDALKHGVTKTKLDQRCSVTRIDLEAHVFTPMSFDGVLSIDDFAYCGFPPHLAQQLFKSLKPGACAVVEAYVGLPCAELATAFASSFSEPQIRAHGDLLQVFKDTGFALEADEDLTEEFVDLARQAFKGLGEKLAKPDALDVLTAQELAWEAEAWRMRLRLLGQRRLERRRFILRRPSGAEAQTEPGQAENTNAPAG